MPDESFILNLDIVTDKSSMSLRTLQEQLKATKIEMQNVEQGAKSVSGLNFDQLKQNFADLKASTRLWNAEMKAAVPDDLKAKLAEATYNARMMNAEMRNSAPQMMISNLTNLAKAGVGIYNVFEALGTAIGGNNEKMKELSAKSLVVIQVMMGLEEIHKLTTSGVVAGTLANLKWLGTQALKILGLQSETVAATEATVAEEALSTATKATPWGAIATAVLAVVSAVYGLYKYFTQTTEAQKDWKEAMEKGREEAAKVSAPINMLSSNLKSHIVVLEDVKGQMLELHSKYPQYIGTVEEYAKGTRNATSDLDKLSAALIRNGIAQAVQNKIIQLSGKLFEQEAKDAEEVARIHRNEIIEIQQVSDFKSNMYIKDKAQREAAIESIKSEKKREIEIATEAETDIKQEIDDIKLKALKDNIKFGNDDLEQNKKATEESNKIKYESVLALNQKIANEYLRSKADLKAALKYEQITREEYNVKLAELNRKTGEEKKKQDDKDFKEEIEKFKKSEEEKLKAKQDNQKDLDDLQKMDDDLQIKTEKDSGEKKIAIDKEAADKRKKATKLLNLDDAESYKLYEQTLLDIDKWAATAKKNVDDNIAKTDLDNTIKNLNKTIQYATDGNEAFKALEALRVAEKKKEGADIVAIDEEINKKELDLYKKLYNDISKISGGKGITEIALAGKDGSKGMEKTGKIASGIISTVSELEQEVTKIALNNIDAKQSATDSMYEQQMKGMDQDSQQYKDLNDAKTKADKDYQQQKNEVTKKSQIAEAEMQIAQIAINTAVAATEALLQPWLLPVIIGLGAVEEALAISNLAKIEATDTTVYAKGGIVNGPSHSNGGVKYSVGGTTVELEGGEGVINRRSMQIPALRQLASNINTVGGGVPFANTAPSIMTARIDPEDMNSIAKIIMDNTNKIGSFNAVVSIKDVNRANKKIDNLNRTIKF